MEVSRNFDTGMKQLLSNFFSFVIGGQLFLYAFFSMMAKSISSMLAQSSISFLMSLQSGLNYSSEALFPNISDLSLCNRNIT